jgi:hypothetical protein
VKYAERSGRAETPFQDTEADTGKVHPKMVLLAKLVHALDHFSPALATSFVELATQLPDMSPTDQQRVFDLASRLAK